MTKPSRKKDTYRFGLNAETIACLFLRLKGYRILARRYRSPVGEVDIIAARGHMLVFVEVKARRKRESLMETITPKQQQRINRAASLFISKHPRVASHNARFDVILISPLCWPVHITDAWRLA